MTITDLPTVQRVRFDIVYEHRLIIDAHSTASKRITSEEIKRWNWRVVRELCAQSNSERRDDEIWINNL